MADDAQPASNDAAQGDAVEGAGPLDGYLEQVSPELREHVKPHLETISRNVDQKFREAADYRKQWEPYEQLGVNQMDPDQLRGLIEFANTAQDDDAFAQWFEETGRDSGLFEQLGYTKADDEGDLGIEGLEGMSPQQIQELVRTAIADEMAPVNDRLSQQEQARQVAETEQEINDQLDKIQADHSDLFGENADDVRDVILRFAYSYAEDNEEDPIAKGFEEYQRVIGQGESGLLARKAGQPGPVEGAGQASHTPPKITDWKQAQDAAKERLQQMQ